MPLKVAYKKKVSGVTLTSGKWYKMKYRAWANDPQPTILFVHSYSGNAFSGRQWRFLTGINISYLPRKFRLKFIKSIDRLFKQNPKIKLTWELWTTGAVTAETTIAMSEQQGLNYAETLKEAVKQVKEFRSTAAQKTSN